MNLIAAASTVTTTTGLDPEKLHAASGVFGMIGFIGIALIVIAAILMPLYVIAIHSTLKRIERLQRQAFADMVNELRAARTPRRP
jgi:uncharacterized membrane protein